MVDAELGFGRVAVVRADMAVVQILFGVARRVVVGIGAGDEAELERVHSVLVFELEPALQRISRKRAFGKLIRRRKRARIRPEHAGRQQLEPAHLVGRADSGPKPVVESALRGSLVLVDLKQGLDRISKRGLLGICRVLEHQAIAGVGIMGDRDDIAATVGIQAFRLQAFPEQRFVVVRVHRADRSVHHVFVPEDHVPVQVLTEPR